MGLENQRFEDQVFTNRIFADRRSAGEALADRLSGLAGPSTVVLGLPRGGVPVAVEVARLLGAPLDVLIVRKVGVPTFPELAMGAVGEDGVSVRNEQVIRQADISDTTFERVQRNELAEVERRALRFRRGQPMVRLAGGDVIIVDDGIATGSTASAAIQVARRHGARRVVVAAPVASSEAVAMLAREADEVIALQTPRNFVAVGRWYRNFEATSDEEVERILAAFGTEQLSSGPGPANPDQESGTYGASPVRNEEVAISDANVVVRGHLTVPADAIGTVIFAHGSGSSRFSHRNIAVADFLQQGQVGTLLFDLLTEAESHERDKIFDIDLLATRLSAATRWLRKQPIIGLLPIGYFGASTGAGAALVSAADNANAISAVVSRGGRPDLAGERLGSVRAPTLLIVGSDDTTVLQLNRDASERLNAAHQLVVVPGATHLFEEPGALEEVSRLALEWFSEHFRQGSDRSTPKISRTGT